MLGLFCLQYGFDHDEGPEPSSPPPVCPYQGLFLIVTILEHR